MLVCAFSCLCSVFWISEYLVFALLGSFVVFFYLEFAVTFGFNLGFGILVGICFLLYGFATYGFLAWLVFWVGSLLWFVF